jgi:hypothetical protein
MRKLILAAAFAFLSGPMVASAQASTVTYNLALTPQSGSTLSGTGTLTFTDGPVSPSGLFNVVLADITTLSISIGGFTFNLVGHTSALQFTDGILSDITASTAIGAASLAVNSTTAVYFDNLATGGVGSTDTITAQLATPLPAALPLFATGLGAMGLLGWRRKRKALAA